MGNPDATPPLHSWKIPLTVAAELQRRLRDRLVLRGRPTPRLVAGIDCSSCWGRGPIWAAVVVYDLADDRIVDAATAVENAPFPYVPGYLSFREGPAVLAAWERLRRRPEAVIFDGQGIAHPRRFGIAAHLGLWLDLPSVGCAKSRFVGDAEEPAPEAGSHAPLTVDGEEVGALLRTRKGAKPVWVSPGHLVGIEGSVQLVLSTCRGRRLPEPTRLAHLESNRARLAGHRQG